MNAADVIGWVVEGTYYCVGCSPTNDTGEEGGQPIFADSETDSFSHCAECEELIPENLTSEGWDYMLELAKGYLVCRRGRPEIQRQWYEAVKSNVDIDVRVLVDLWGEALREDNLACAEANLSRRYILKLKEIHLAIDALLKEEEDG